MVKLEKKFLLLQIHHPTAKNSTERASIINEGFFESAFEISGATLKGNEHFKKF